MTTAFTFLIVLFFCSPVVAQDLPPDMLADQYLLEATEAMERGELLTAVRAFEKIEALEVKPPPLCQTWPSPEVRCGDWPAGR